MMAGPAPVGPVHPLQVGVLQVAHPHHQAPRGPPGKDDQQVCHGEKVQKHFPSLSSLGLSLLTGFLN